MRLLFYGLILLVLSAGGCGGDKKTENQARPLPPSSAATAKPGPAHEPAAGDAAKLLGEYVTFPSAGVEIRQPDGFEKAGNFDGFEQADTQASILAMSVPGPYKEMTAAFSQEVMSKHGWTLLSKAEHRIDGFDGVLVHVRQPVKGDVFIKWSLAFGDDKRTRLVTATCPESREQQVSEKLRLAVLSTRPSTAAPPEPGSDLPFTLSDSKRLKRTPAISHTLAFTKDGTFPVQSPNDPIFVVAPAIGNVAFGNDLREYAEKRLRSTPQIKDLSIQSTEPIKIAGLDGYETIARADDRRSGTPLAVYQVILFEQSSYILMQGFVGRENEKEFLPEFKALARSLRRKQP